MEPRPFERGNPMFSGRFVSSSQCFNGATSFRTWKPENQEQANRRIPASMEPRPFERGNIVDATNAPTPIFCFNGATSFRTWKPVYPIVLAATARTASMEPRPFERGNTLVRVFAMPLNRGASMEPRPFERGNLSF